MYTLRAILESCGFKTKISSKIAGLYFYMNINIFAIQLNFKFSKISLNYILSIFLLPFIDIEFGRHFLPPLCSENAKTQISNKKFENQASRHLHGTSLSNYTALCPTVSTESWPKHKERQTLQVII